MCFDRQDLKGKTVLDLGAGPDARLASGLHEAGITDRVVSLSPDFVMPRHYKRAREKHPDGAMVAGVGQALPFKDGSFDAVMALHVEDHLSAEGAIAMAREIGRVLAPGGVGRVGPIIAEDYDLYEELRAGRSSGIAYKQVPIPADVMPRVKVRDPITGLGWHTQPYVLEIARKPVPAFHADTIVHRQQPEDGRDLATYEAQLLIDRGQELIGKRVLDLGAGPEAKLAHQLRTSHTTDEVVSLSPDYTIDHYHRRARRRQPESPLVAGVGQALPFADESFDTVLAFHMYEHLPRATSLDTAYEIARVLKPDGTGRIGPIFNTPGEWAYYRELLNRQKMLQDQGKTPAITFEQQWIPESTLPRIRMKDSFGGGEYMHGYVIRIRKPSPESDR